MSSFTIKLRRVFLYWCDSNEFPWMFPRPLRVRDADKPIQHLRTYARKIIRCKRVADQGWPRTLTQAAAWPLVSVVKAWVSASDQFPKKVDFRSRCSTFFQRWWMQVWHQFRIYDQREVQLDDPLNRERIDSFMPCLESQVILAALNQCFPGSPEIDDKTTFAQFCRLHSLPHAITLVASDRAPAEATPWPLQDLFLKPSNLGQGKGMEVIRYAPETGLWTANDGTVINRHTISDYAQKRYSGGPWLLQPRLQNAPEWQGFTNGALSTARIVTCRSQPNGDPIFIGGFIRFPLKGAIIDNLSAGGIGAGLLGEEGVMTSGWVWHGAHNTFTTYPETGALIEGERLPRCSELVALALKAHQATDGWTTIGWDVTLTAEGPVLIEANLHWAVLAHEPLNNTPFLKCMQSHFGPNFERLPHATT